MPEWGIDTAGTTTTTPNWCRAMGGTSPNIDNMLLKSVSIYVGSTHTQQIRLAVYSGGNLTTGPDGATLVYDAGVTSGTALNTWLTINIPTEVILPKNAVTWVAFRNNGGYIIHYYGTSPAGNDFQTARGRYSSTVLDGDETSAFPSTWPSDGGAFAAFWYSTYIIYQIRYYGGLFFESSSSMYLSSVSSFTPPANCSVSFWLFHSNDGGTPRIVSHSDNWEIWINASNQISNDMNWGTSLVSSATINTNTRYYIVCTRASDNTLQIYVNGQFDNSSSGGTGSPGSATFYVGVKQTLLQYFDGYIEDLRIYNRVLSANEIATIYGCKGTDSITYGLIHKWPMQEKAIDVVASGTGSIIDLGPSRLDLTPNNNPTYSGTQLKFKRFG